MSKYTTEIRWIVEQNSSPNQSIVDRIIEAAPLIFNFDFPIWSEDYRLILEKKILHHYYMREIAFETVGLWKMYLNQSLNEIMPYYIELYNINMKKFDYLNDTYIQEIYTRELGSVRKDLYGNSSTSSLTENETGETTSTNSESGKTTTNTNDNNTRTPNLQNLRSDLPQTTAAQIAGIDHYANTVVKDTGTETNNRDIDSSATSTNSSNGSVQSTNTNTSSSQTDNHGNSSQDQNVSENIKRSKIGNQGGKSQTQLMVEFRESLINIDMMIIDNLKDLFFTLW